MVRSPSGFVGEFRERVVAQRQERLAPQKTDVASSGSAAVLASPRALCVACDGPASQPSGAACLAGMAADRCRQVTGRCSHRRILVADQCVHRGPAAVYGLVGCMLHVELRRIAVVEDRLQQFDHAGPAGDAVRRCEVPQKRNRCDSRIEDGQLTEPQREIIQCIGTRPGSNPGHPRQSAWNVLCGSVSMRQLVPPNAAHALEDRPHQAPSPAARRSPFPGGPHQPTRPHCREASPTRRLAFPDLANISGMHNPQVLFLLSYKRSPFSVLAHIP